MISKENIDYLATKIDDYFLKNIKQWVELNIGAINVLELLSQKSMKLSLITNNSRRITDEILRTFNLQDYFNIIITLTEMQNPKPDPSAFFFVIEQWNIDRDEIFFIGDSPTDLESSIEAKIPFILVKPTKAAFNFKEIPSSTKVINGIFDLIMD